MKSGDGEVKARIVILAGPNGAGKTTAAPFVLRNELHIKEFVNADIIASGISSFNPEDAAISAGRIMLLRLKGLAAEKASFAFETTLASKSFLPWISALVDAGGYEFFLHFLWLPNGGTANARVGQRVELGGHFVPEESVYRRYHGGLKNFPKYAALASEWTIYNSSLWPLREIAKGGRNKEITIVDAVSWSLFQEASK